ncbi:hypothetical protein HG535_0D02960 [Zygotorulaspora mrakii]|uniref:Dihydrofolate synthetase n=1 Tax=Zygotorulaspora mrakii TaxID=42260 RepID=A0A7H9B1R0_ZYGMR|nr:uncharacterized protein HG535_0D02960 [Zygotorulaspora mrakii]QLG72588.1 hypothetical protein HG535_0D02960 [Zygotorulaspora mrakii]
MSINLGLRRVVALLGYLGNPQERLKVLHVAGTNGKGSVCSYLTSILQQHKPSLIGKFTSPHLIHVTDSITINGTPIPWNCYEDIRNHLDTLNNSHSLQCTEFELLTCTALKYFHDVKCDWCVIEVGLGGRLDATNVIPGRCKLACGITKVGLDHESILGNNLAQIAKEKAGIITKGVPFAAVDGSNDISVIKEVKEQCNDKLCELDITEATYADSSVKTKSWEVITPKKLPLNGFYQINNLRVACSMLDNLQQKGHICLSANDIHGGLQNVNWPGRLHELDYCFDSEKKSTVSVLLDGAHNGAAAVELARYLRDKYGDKPLTFVLAVTSGKNLDSLLSPLLRSEDKVITTEFGKVDGMPWIHATPYTELATYIKRKYTKNVETQPLLTKVIPSIVDACHNDGICPIVVCGSLYLCGELLRIHSDNLNS